MAGVHGTRDAMFCTSDKLAAWIASRKLECGRSLCILGVDMVLSNDGYTCPPYKDKVEKCLGVIGEALRSGQLSSAAAQKLAGRSSWASQYLFHRSGRAMLRPIFKQKFSKSGRIDSNPGLQLALRWWRRALAQDIVEKRAWTTSEDACVHLLFSCVVGCRL